MLQIKPEDHKFSSRLLPKGRNSTGESSFRVLYYGKSSGSVPFTWETKPGTPKHPGSLSSLPPLTPPPSFQSNSTPNSKPAQIKGSKPNVFLNIFLGKSSKTSHVSPSHTSPSGSSSSRSFSSYSSASGPMNSFVRRRRRGWLPRSRSTGGMSRRDREEEAGGSPTSTSCLGGGYGFFRQFSSRRSKVNVKFPL